MNTVLFWLLSVTAILVGLVYFFVWLFSHTPRKPFPSELTYTTNDEDGESHKFNPSDLNDIELSVVIPCYNETSRLRSMLVDAVAYLRKTYGKRFEIIIVDDGSKDGTATFALELATEFQLPPKTMKVIQFVKNRGKGGAVCQGMQRASGNYIMFADADGASKFSDLGKLMVAIQDLDGGKPGEIPAVALGSRAYMVNTDAVVKRAFIRNLLMYGLHTLVYIFGIRDIKDTQCGFKLFNRAAMETICPKMHTEGWIFDVEMLILAERRHVKVAEIPISWHEVKGSKMVLGRDSLNMGIDLVDTRLAYILGIYGDGGGSKNKTE